MSGANATAPFLLLSAGAYLLDKKPQVNRLAYIPAMVAGLLYMPFDSRLSASRRAHQTDLEKCQWNYDTWIRLRRRWMTREPPLPKPTIMSEYSAAVEAERIDSRYAVLTYPL